MTDKKSKEDREYEDLIKEIEAAQNDKFVLDEDFDVMGYAHLGYAYGGKIMKKSVGGKMDYKKRGSRQERTITVPNPYSTSLYDTPQKDALYKPTKTKKVKLGELKRPSKPKNARAKRFLRRP